MLGKYPETRPTASEALKNPILNSLVPDQLVSNSKYQRNNLDTTISRLSISGVNSRLSNNTSSKSFMSQQINFSEYIVAEEDSRPSFCDLDFSDKHLNTENPMLDAGKSHNRGKSNELMVSSIAIMNDTKKKSSFFKLSSANDRE